MPPYFVVSPYILNLAFLLLGMNRSKTNIERKKTKLLLAGVMILFLGGKKSKKPSQILFIVPEV